MKNKKRKQKSNEKENKERSFIICEMSILISISLAFISVSWLVNNWCQALFISIGTGLLASAIVSYAFWKIQKESENRIAKQKRALFMYDAKICFYNLIGSIDFATNVSCECSLEEYIKNQHRWFHEYYKKLVADNEDKAETELRIKQLNNFIEDIDMQFCSLFESNATWKEGNFDEWQISELRSLFKDYNETKIYFNKNNYKQAFLCFAEFLEVFKRVMSGNKFEELRNFTLITFSYDENGELTVNEEDFEKQESFFKFAKSFNRIRHENYIKYYGKNAEREQNNG